jgi:hypothetical protein
MNNSRTNIVQLLIYSFALLLFLAIGIVYYKYNLHHNLDANLVKVPEKNSYITNNNRSDGFGAQFQNTVLAVVYAEMNGYKYAYSPFLTMEHNYDNDSDFLNKKEQLINFSDNFESSKDHPNVIVFNGHVDFFEKNIEQSAKSESLKKIKRIFRQNKPKDYYNNGKFNIAIHMRKVNAHDCLELRCPVPERVYLKIINYFKLAYGNKDYLIHIYSQGNISDFENYVGDNIVFHIDESLEDTFTGMVYADVLLTAPSSLSYTAGLLSEGEVYYIPFWHKPLPTWQVFNFKRHDPILRKLVRNLFVYYAKLEQNIYVF